MFLGAFSLLFLQAKMFLQTDVHTHTRTVLWMFDRRRRLSNEIISNLIDISFLSKDEPQHPTPLGLLLCRTQPGKYAALLYFVSQKDLPRQGHCFQGSNTCGGKCYLKHAITRHFAGQWLSSSAALERAQYCFLRKDNSQRYKQGVLGTCGTLNYLLKSKYYLLKREEKSFDLGQKFKHSSSPSANPLSPSPSSLFLLFVASSNSRTC